MLRSILVGMVTAIVVVHSAVHASYLVPNDDQDYLLLENKLGRFIYSDDHQDYLEQVMQEVQFFSDHYQQSFDWALDRPLELILASYNNQIPNAMATALYNNTMIFYGGIVSMVDNFAVNSLGRTLIGHEMAHIYQMNAKGGLARYASKVFGNKIFTMLLPLPLWAFHQPNMLLPTWLIEGNATYNESTYGNGGRLFSGEARALFYQLIREDRLNVTSLLNESLQFPFGRQHYIVGAYFNLYLAKRFGHQRVNTFFLTHGTRYFNPFRLDASFRLHFGMSYNSLVSEFIQNFQPQANKQQQAESSKPFIHSLSHYGFTRQQNQLSFLATNKVRYPQVVTFDTQSEKYSAQEFDLPGGTIFWQGKRPFSAASGFVGQSKMLYSLWDQDGNALTKYNSQVVLDQQAESTLYFNPAESFIQPMLYLDQQKIGPVSSTAKFDRQGKIYYFKQQASQRTLYRYFQQQEEALCSYSGYYGKVVDVDPDGSSVYFIASTEYGSSLFGCFKGKITRQLAADTIIDARQVTSKRFLVANLMADGYHYQLVDSTERQELPANYQYDQLPPIGVELEKSVVAPNSDPQRDYNGFYDLRFDYWEYFYSNTDQGDSSLSAQVAFSDPLQWHSWLLSYSRDSLYGSGGELTYIYSRYLLNVGVKLIADDLGNQAGVIFALPWRFGRTNLSLIDSAIYRQDRERFFHQFDLDLTYQRSFGLSYYPFIEHYLRARIKDEPGYLTQTARIGGQWDLGRETPIWGRISYVNWAPRESRFHTHYEGSEIPTPSFNLYSRNYQQKEMGGVASIAIGKPLHFTLFSDWFPLGVRRIAPRLIYHHSRWKRSSEGERIIDDFGSAVGMELLMAHRFSFRVEIAAFKREAQLIGQAETDSYYLMFNLSGANF